MNKSDTGATTMNTGWMFCTDCLEIDGDIVLCDTHKGATK